ncbi:zinc finger protein Paris-like [Battus philenor]|uniref:zinc finger protein Paris-like n=1 Tax=Battus philenor TaxID=42288 RepID=UPI0035D0AE37
MSDSFPWTCCRTCLSTSSLHPIFARAEHSEKYSNLIILTTGIKVEINDSLPKEMCSICIGFINECIKFRKRCKDAQKVFADVKLNDVKPEHEYHLKIEYDSTEIDISELLPPEEDLKDYDNIIDTLKCETEPSSDDKVDDIVNITETKESKISRKIKKTPKRRSVKSKDKKECEKESKIDSKQEVECEFCHKILTSKLSLRNHYKIHTGFDFVCEHCGKKFITRRLLLMHCRAKHGYEKTDKCSFCDYKASNAEQVKIHERLHTGEKPFACQECGAGFHRKSSYLQHIAIHLPEKTVQCAQCPALFKSVTLMRIHAARHRAPRYAFRCALCDGRFARRRNVARHLQRVHALHPDQLHIQRLKLP